MLPLRSLVLATSVALAVCSWQARATDTTPAATVALAATGAAASATAMTSNPFFHASTLPFQAPPFNKITDADYQPAIEEGMKLQLAEIEKIANNPAPPTFKNTYVAMQKSGVMLDRVMAVFNGVTAANTNSTLQKVQKEEAPKLAAHQDAIFLNDKLFKRVKAVYNRRDTLKLDPESARLVEVVYRKFVHAGAKLSDADKTKLKTMNQEASTLSTRFHQQVGGGDQGGRARVQRQGQAHRAVRCRTGGGQASGREPQGSRQICVAAAEHHAAARAAGSGRARHAQELFEASWNRAEQNDANDTRETIERLAQLRAQEAALLGYPNYAAWKLDDQMAQTPATVMTFMDKLAPAAVARAKGEAADIQAQIDKDQKGLNQPGFELKPWDWQRYAEKVRKAKLRPG